MSSPQPPLPTFVIIGAQKSATRWLRTTLGEHPGIYTAPAELHFWNRPHRVEDPEGLRWYRDKFEGWSGEPITGEATPGYMIWRHHPANVAARMKPLLPEARLIAILRNPIDRANSAMKHHIRRRRLPPNARLVDVARERQPTVKDRLCIVTGGWYAQSLAGFQQEYGPNLLVLLHDDLIDRPERVYETAVRHVGAPSGFRPPSLSRHVFRNALGRRTGKYSLTTEERCEMWEYFRDDVAELEQMFGLDLSRWEPRNGDCGADAAAGAPWRRRERKS